MWFYMNERMNVLISSLRRYNLETLAVSYTGTETLDWMRLFGDAVQSNQVCTFDRWCPVSLGHTGMD